MITSVDDIPLAALFSALVVLIVLSGCFSGSETGMMALNRYRLRHLADQGLRGARRAQRLLERPDRLIGLILLGNNLVNNLAAALVTVIGLRLLGDLGVALGPIIFTIVMLIFAEVLPKTIAALHPERVAFPASAVLSPLLRVLYPLVWLVNAIVSQVLRLVGMRLVEAEGMALSREELRTVVKEAGAMIPRKHQQMLFAILDLEQATVEDIMVPRSEVSGIDLEDPLADLEDQIVNARHTRMPVYRGNINRVVGILHARSGLRLINEHALTIEAIERILVEPYYVPIGTPLHTQLIEFQRARRRMGLVVDEYGEIEGLVTLEDLLEEIVGEFTTDTQSYSRDLHPQADGSYLIDGGAHLREVNRIAQWDLPTHGPKTLNGLLLEVLESIPEPGTSVRIGDYTFEIVQTTGTSVKTARVRRLELPPAAAHGSGRRGEGAP